MAVNRHFVEKKQNLSVNLFASERYEKLTARSCLLLKVEVTNTTFCHTQNFHCTKILPLTGVCSKLFDDTM